jgi:ssRNA-specific RNase YbeY (16S rRNA maturation enzyme)
MTIDIYAADEQHDHEVDLERWVKLANAALTDEGVRGLCEVSLIFLDEPTIAALNQQFMGKSGPTDVLSFPIDRARPRRGWQWTGRTGDSRDSPDDRRHCDLSRRGGAQRARA